VYPWIRAVKVGAAALAGARLNLSDPSRISLRVWPGDLDAMLHLNNGRYLSLMDLGRLDLALRTGLVPLCRRRHWRPLLAAATVRYWHPLELFTPFTLETRLVWWDRKWCYLEQDILVGGRKAAQGLMKLVFKGPGGTVPPAEMAQALGADPQPPPPPPGLAAWSAWEDALKNQKPPGA
jgi:acyl-CoA thioesterase FadM